MVTSKEFARDQAAMDQKIKSDVGEVVLAGDEEEDGDVVLPGFRFHPTDEELVTFYLRRKVARKSLSIEIIKEMDIYKHDPWDLPKASTVGGEKEWYFFCLRGRKYRNSIRPNRVTGSGFWKATGIDRPIYSTAAVNNNSGESIGLKKSLVYYRGSAGKGTKTDWMMHEFRLPPAIAAANASPCMQEAEVWTICRIFKRSVTYRKQQQQQQQQAWRPPAPATVTIKAPPPGDSSSNTGSFESDGGGDEFMNCGLAPAAIAQQQHGRHQMMSTMSCNGGYFFNDGMHHSHSHHKLHSQWGSLQMEPEPEQKPLSTPAMTIAFHQNDHGFPAATAAAADFYKDGYLEEIARMMEVADPSPTGLYDCRYA